MQFPSLRVLILSTFASVALLAQAPPPFVPPGFGPRPEPPKPAAEQAPPAAVAAPGQPGAPRTAAATPLPTPTGGLSLENASLTAVIDILARQLKLNYILDPQVKATSSSTPTAIPKISTPAPCSTSSSASTVPPWFKPATSSASSP